ALGRPVTAAGSGPCIGPLEVRPAYDEASRALSALRALGREGDGAGTDELGFVGLLLADQLDVGGFVRRTLGPVLDYDEKRGTDLVPTLEAYFAAGSNLARTKDTLHVHVNTVTQRLDRVAQLLGAGWTGPDRTLEVQLALRLHRLQAGPPKG
nr:helix-turn-helix domain-containing protein [Sporichthyaceae bacterium]